MCWNRVAADTSASRLIGCALYKQMHCCRCHDVQLAGFWSRMSHQAHFTRNCGAARSGFLCMRCLQQRRQRIYGPKQRKPTHFIRCTPDHFCSKLLGGSRSVVDSFAFIATFVTLWPIVVAIRSPLTLMESLWFITFARAMARAKVFAISLELLRSRWSASTCLYCNLAAEHANQHKLR
jgi:hypothetical protein